MKAEWTVAPASAVELGDDADKNCIVLEALSGSSLEQVDPLFRAVNVSRQARANVAGECVFTVETGFATRAAAVAGFKAEYARMNGKGSLVLTEGASTLTMANAILTAVQLVRAVGLRWTIRYRFGITTIT